jgi:hypothetical protein
MFSTLSCAMPDVAAKRQAMLKKDLESVMVFAGLGCRWM